jgi:hypothetical protein
MGCGSIIALRGVKRGGVEPRLLDQGSASQDESGPKQRSENESRYHTPRCIVAIHHAFILVREHNRLIGIGKFEGQVTLVRGAVG